MEVNVIALHCQLSLLMYNVIYAMSSVYCVFNFAQLKSLLKNWIYCKLQGVGSIISTQMRTRHVHHISQCLEWRSMEVICLIRRHLPQVFYYSLITFRKILNIIYTLNCFKVSESNNSDVRGSLWSSWPLHNFFKWHVFRSIPPLTHHEFGKW